MGTASHQTDRLGPSMILSSSIIVVTVAVNSYALHSPHPNPLPKEREPSCRAPKCEAGACDSIGGGSPSPWGEGWGEGECDRRQKRSSYIRFDLRGRRTQKSTFAVRPTCSYKAPGHDDPRVSAQQPLERCIVA